MQGLGATIEPTLVRISSRPLPPTLTLAILAHLLAPFGARLADSESAAAPAGHPPGPVCMLPAIPLLGGIEINRNKLAKKKQEPRPPHSLKLGPLPCCLVPLQGLFTKESGLDPLDAQWRSKPPSDRP